MESAAIFLAQRVCMWQRFVPATVPFFTARPLFITGIEGVLRMIDKYTFPNTEWWVFWIVSESLCGVYDDAWAFEMERGKVQRTRRPPSQDNKMDTLVSAEDEKNMNTSGMG